MLQPHPDRSPSLACRCAVLTVSDTRTLETDRSGQMIQSLLVERGHQVVDYRILKDEPIAVRLQLQQWCLTPELDAVILNGGTGIAPRDTTYDAIATLLEKTLPGFGELFRWLSYQEIGSRAMASRAIAGVYRQSLIFALPGSSHGVQMAMEKLILPELPHLLGQLQGRTSG